MDTIYSAARTLEYLRIVPHRERVSRGTDRWLRIRVLAMSREVLSTCWDKHHWLPWYDKCSWDTVDYGKVLCIFRCLHLTRSRCCIRSLKVIWSWQCAIVGLWLLFAPFFYYLYLLSRDLKNTALHSNSLSSFTKSRKDTHTSQISTSTSIASFPGTPRIFSVFVEVDCAFEVFFRLARRLTTVTLVPIHLSNPILTVLICHNPTQVVPLLL